MRELILKKEHIELYKILKFEGLCSSGGEAKSKIAEGLVTVNGEVELQKRKKIVSGDTIVFNETEIQVSSAT
jgi:ribosome-associated protein